MARTKVCARARRGIQTSSPGSEHGEDQFLTEHDYGITWPITDREVAKYTEVQQRPITGTRFIRQRMLDVELDKWGRFKHLLRNAGLRHFFTCKAPAYHELVQEFYTTVRRDERLNFSLHCRLNGRPVEIYPQTIREVFKMTNSWVTSFPPNVTINDIWMTIGGGEPWKTRGGVKSALIKDGLHCIFHKFLAHSVFGKTESNKISQNELLILWSAIHGREIDVATLLFNKLDDCARGVSGMNLVLGHVLTALAEKKNLIEPGDLDRFTRVTSSDIDVQSLCSAHIVSMDDTNKFVPWQERPAYRTLARTIGIDFGSSSGLPDEPVEEDVPAEGGHHYDDVPMPDVPSHEPGGPSTSDYTSMDMMREQFDRMDTRLQRMEDNQEQYYSQICTRLEDLQTNQREAYNRILSIDTRLQDMERNQQLYYSQFGSFPPQPPPS